ncbi:MAG: LamG-like jellyroll fold domain-containing protein [Thermoguttaceae bacterium]|nr:LamG-like jellyroll fold domain-containing protein [Thermoguttaceae bacterium]
MRFSEKHVLAMSLLLSGLLSFAGFASLGDAAVIGYWTLDDSTLPTAAASIGPDATYENFTVDQLQQSDVNPLQPSGTSVQFLAGGSPYERINLGENGGMASGQSALTMAMWVEFHSLDEDHTLASIGQFTSGQPLIFWRDEDASGTYDTIAVLIGGNRTAGSGGELNDNGWHHVAFTYQANTSSGLRVYVDGVQRGSSSTSSSEIPESSSPLVLGNASSGPAAGKQFHGLMDEVGIWDTALPADSILAMATGNLVGGKTYSQLIGANDYAVSGGTVTFNGPNMYSGETQVDAGVLRITHGGALGTTSGGTTVAGDARLELSGGITVTGETLTISGGGGNNMGALQSQSGANIWSGSVALAANGTRIGANGFGQSLTVSGVIDDGSNNYTLAVRNADTGGTVILSGANTYGGETHVVVGLLQIAGGDNRLPAGTVLRIGNSSNAASATFDMNGQNQQVAGLASDGTSMPQTVTNSSDTTLSTLTVNGSSDYVYAGALTGNLALIKAGSGMLTLSGANTYTGDTTITGGALRVRHPEALGAAGTTTVSSGARVELYGGVTVADESVTIHGNGGNSQGALQSASGENTWAGNVVIGSAGTRIGSYSGTLTISGEISGNYGLIVRNNGTGRVTVFAGENTYTGATQVVGGVTKIDGGHNRLPVGTTLQLGLSYVSGEFDLNGWNQEVAGLQIAQTTGTYTNVLTNSSTTPSILTVNQSASNSFSGAITGNLALTKDGGGTLTLTGDNTYTGATTIDGGTLALSHASSNNIPGSALVRVTSGASLDVTALAGGTFAVADGQTLGGSGTVNGHVEVAGLEAALSPGTSVGTLNLQGDLAFAADAFFDIDIEDVGLADLVQMDGGTLTPGNATIRVSLLDNFHPDYRESWTILTGEDLIDGTFKPEVSMIEGSAFLAAGKRFEISYGNSVVLTVVPEPGGWLLLAWLVACGLLVRRR